MEKNYLIINTGSASKKYSFYKGTTKVYTAHFEMENGSPIVTEKTDDSSEKRSIDAAGYAGAVGIILESLIAKNIIASREEMNLIGIRIVAPGEYFLTNRFIDDEYLKMAEEAVKKVPLHLGPALEEIKNIKKWN